MQPPVPRLEDYGLSPDGGFLPDEAPLQHLPHPAYDRWERIASNFHALILSRRLRAIIDRLPVIPAVHLDAEAEWRRAYVLLCFMANGYIWCEDKPAQILPPSITYPLLQVCERLELPPVATFAALCLWNFKPIFHAGDLALDNLSTLLTFTGSTDEQWFYLVSVAIEAHGGRAMPVMLGAIEAARRDDAPAVTACLQSLAQTLDEVGSLLLRMYESCDPHVFYHRIRPFLAGSKNMRQAGLGDAGVFYDDGTAAARWRQYSGGSNAQSSLIQFFDIVLGVEHAPTGTRVNDGSTTATSESDTDAGTRPPPKPRHSFIHEMRQYMPGPHRRFLQAVEAVANIRDFVTARRFAEPELCIAYDASLAMLRALRDKHLQIVSRYVIVKSHESRSLSRTRLSSATSASAASATSAAASNASTTSAHSPTSTTRGRTSAPDQRKKGRMRGTGGTALIPFLKQARDETGEPAVDEWARKVLMGGRKTEADAEIAYINSLALTAEDLAAPHDAGAGAGAGHAAAAAAAATADKSLPSPAADADTVGLAGRWDLEDASGGLCGY